MMQTYLSALIKTFQLDIQYSVELGFQIYTVYTVARAYCLCSTTKQSNKQRKLHIWLKGRYKETFRNISGVKFSQTTHGLIIYQSIIKNVVFGVLATTSSLPADEIS